MALTDLLNSVNKKSENITNISDTRLEEATKVGAEYISFWRWYPDIFVDKLVEWGGGKFRFYYYQRV